MCSCGQRWGGTPDYTSQPPSSLHMQKPPGVGVGAQGRTRRDLEKGVAVNTPGASQQRNSTREDCQVSCFAGNPPRACSFSMGTITTVCRLPCDHVILGGGIFPNSSTRLLSIADRASPGPEGPLVTATRTQKSALGGGHGSALLTGPGSLCTHAPEAWQRKSKSQLQNPRELLGLA